jgi:hypothetical protein
VLRPEGDALIIDLQGTGAQFRLEPWDGAGKPVVLRITLDDGQAYEFRREPK